MLNITADSSPPGEHYCPACEKAFVIGGLCPNDGGKLIHLGTNVDPFLGLDLDGKYTIREKLGQGGMGAVYRAEQHGLEREVAIKLINPRHSSTPEVIKRFLREAKLASRLGHPHAVGIIDFGQTHDGACYLVMELVTGFTLQEVFAAQGVFPPERLVRVAAQICEVLECAHALEIVHRDLKPSNVMLLARERDFAKVLDFGLAKSVASDDATPVTASGVLLGTPAYMPPELALGQRYDGRADLYSLGVMLYLLGSGRLPFRSSSRHEMIALHSSEPAPPMTGVPRALAQIVDRLLRKDPAERYPTAAAVREAIEHALVDRDTASVDAPSSRSRTDLRPADTRSALDSSPDAPDASVPPGRGAWRWFAPAVIGTLVIAAGAFLYLVLANDSPLVATISRQPSLATADASVTASPQAPDAVASFTSAPADAVPTVSPPVPAPIHIPKPTEPARPRGPKPTRSAHLLGPKPTRPAHPPQPRLTGPAHPPEPRLTEPAHPPEPQRAGSGSAQSDHLPF